MIIPAADADTDVAPAPSCWENGRCIGIDIDIGIVRLLKMTMLLLMKGRNNVSRMRIDLVVGDIAQGHTVADVAAAAAASGRNYVTSIFIGSTRFVHLAALDDQRLLLLVVKMSMCPVGTGQLPRPSPFLPLPLMQNLLLPPPIPSFHGFASLVLLLLLLLCLLFWSVDCLATLRLASSFCRLVSDVVAGKLDNGFAVIRPPGHHAEPSLAGGYCVLNNVALGAAYAREKLGVAKILIVDWDIHHGNGTQSAFINDADVLCFSVHRYHNGNYFSFLGGNGGPGMVGEGKGAGFNVTLDGTKSMWVTKSTTLSGKEC